jgi:hypothetical protein
VMGVAIFLARKKLSARFEIENNLSVTQTAN